MITGFIGGIVGQSGVEHFKDEPVEDLRKE
jgi:hypothetical protein